MTVERKLQGALPLLLQVLLVSCGGVDPKPFSGGPGDDDASSADATTEAGAVSADDGGASASSSGSSGAASGSGSSGSSSGATSSASGSSSSGGHASSSGSASSGASGSGSSASGSSSGSGTSSGGSSSGGSASSGSSSGAGGPACTYGTPFNGSGSFTWYYFGQGTAQQNGSYLTACGYQGTESGMIDTVQNIANTSPASDTYFAAIPGSSGFNTVNSCGACVQITNGGTSIIATVIDECPTDNGQNPLCAQAGHLDLSYGAWKALGYSTGNPSGTTWKLVSCPVTGNITARVKSGNQDQVYIQNTLLPITSVTYNGQQANHLSYGVWQLPNGAAAAGATLVLTDVEGHMVTVTIPGGGGDTGKQFPNKCP